MTDMMIKTLARRAVCGVAALVFIIVSAPASAAEAPPIPLAEQQRIDNSLGAFDDPMVVRMRTRVPPVWRGPQAEPPFTEQRNCPGFIFVDPGGIVPPVFVVPGFC